MIARLKGILIDSSFSEVILDVNGVGYLVLIPLSTFDALPQPGNEAVLLVNTQVREDAICLYGFATAGEKNLFEQLMTVNGVGAKLALAILSSMPPAAFCAAIMSNDVNIIKTIPGVGKKTAERLILEMRDKINKLEIAAGPIVTPDVPASLKDTVADTIRALEGLGFKRDRITRAINELTAEMPEKDCTLENLIRNALRLLNS
jgi:Holliday junction DNA helicase RuvA